MTNPLIQAIEKDDFAAAIRTINENHHNATNTADSEGNYPLHLAVNFSLYHPLSENVKKSLHEIAIALLAKGANPNVKDQWGSAPIHYATIHGNLDLITKLIEYGADYNALDGAKETPLHQALRRKKDFIVNLLLSKPQLSFEETAEGQTPLDYAKRYRFMVSELQSKLH
jgi:ankyrin repeat protein